MAAARVHRTIRFFAWESLPERPEFDPARAAAAIAALDEDNWRYEASDMTTAAIIDRSGAGGDPVCLRFFRLREGDDVPHKMDLARTTIPVEIEEGESITDWTHAVIWPDGYAAHDPHRDAPSLARLASYIRQKTNERVNFVSLFDRNLIDQLRALDDLRSVELRIAKPNAVQDALDRNLGLFEGVLNMARESESATVSTKISVGRERKRHLNPDVKEDVVALAEVASDFLDQLVVKGTDDGRTVTIDLLNQRVQRSRSVPRSNPRVRQPDASQMYDAMIALRAELENDGALQAAARGRIG